MPPADAILVWATTVANDWRWLAVAWHAVMGTLLVLMVCGWRPSARLLGYVVLAPVVSVSVLAWRSANPFNAGVFALLAATLAAMTSRFATSPVIVTKSAWTACGLVFAMLGWTYPHFVHVESWAMYSYASPLGLVPCPTLLFVIGTTLIFQNWASVSWHLTLAFVGLLYGAIGVFQLEVGLDWALLVASATVALALVRDVTDRRLVRADAIGRRRTARSERQCV